MAKKGEYDEVAFYPFETEPVPCAPVPEESHTFTTTDTAIALQIAVGSVTSLDALMILQAAAGGWIYHNFCQ